MGDFTEADVIAVIGDCLINAGANSGTDLHASWRCADKDRYPEPCDCIEQVAAGIFAAVAPALRDRWRKEESPKWWIADGPLARDGVKVLGPFATQELALTVRSHIEEAEDTDRYWVDCDDEQRSGGDQ